MAAWSAWSPPDSGLAGERDIANEISPLYRASPASQLVLVDRPQPVGYGHEHPDRAARPDQPGACRRSRGRAPCTRCAGSARAARSRPARRLRRGCCCCAAKRSSSPSTRSSTSAGSTTSWRSCRPGTSQQTSRLTSTPPAPGKTSKTIPVDLAVVFQKPGLQHFLYPAAAGHAPEQLPPTVGEMASAPEAELVSVITGQAMFTQQLIQGQDGSSVLVLNPAAGAVAGLRRSCSALVAFALGRPADGDNAGIGRARSASAGTARTRSPGCCGSVLADAGIAQAGRRPVIAAGHDRHPRVSSSIASTNEA